MEINQETSPANDLRHGQQTVSMVEQVLCIDGFRTNRGVLVRADDNNTARVFIGGKGVTTQTGMPLPAGQAIVIPVDNPAHLYLISTANAQNVAWMGV